jgi:hypothetical protein
MARRTTQPAPAATPVAGAPPVADPAELQPVLAATPIEADDDLVEVIAVSYPGLSPGARAWMTPTQAEIEISRGVVRLPPADNAG